MFCLLASTKSYSTIMSHAVKCIASPTSWNEDRSQTTTPRVTMAEVVLALSPAPSGSPVEATTSTAYQMAYLPGGNASFVFTETITAKKFLEKEGTFVVQGKGTFTAKTYIVKADFDIVQGTGTGGLEGIHGRGSFGPPEEGSKQLLYEFDVAIGSKR